jgi:hypothetical protein
MNSMSSFDLLVLIGELVSMVAIIGAILATLFFIALPKGHPLHPVTLAKAFNSRLGVCATFGQCRRAYARAREVVWRQKSPDTDPFAGPLHKLP